MKTICLGDSLTYGYGLASPADAWPALCQTALGGEWVNAGINGDTAVGMLSRLPHDILPQRPKYVLLLGGVNDILVSGTSAGARSAIMAMVHQCAAAGIRPVVGIPTPMLDAADNPWRVMLDLPTARRELASYQEWLRLLCRTMCLRCIDFAAAFDGAADLSALYQADGLHPNAHGHRLMAETVINSRIFH